MHRSARRGGKATANCALTRVVDDLLQDQEFDSSVAHRQRQLGRAQHGAGLLRSLWTKAGSFYRLSCCNILPRPPFSAPGYNWALPTFRPVGTL